ncbi:MAG TPA: 2-oxoacid:ferredoxin oxidoreductase subunit beta [Bacillota bacterium]|nr:2-oxoacid:ferredoxin oxidoreductase subunit beta [Bacillota bacterium]
MPDAPFDSEQKPVWCPGCGDYGIMAALKQAFVSLGLGPHQAVIVSGIGCGSKLPDYVHAYGYMSIHGRPLAVATGVKLANPELTVVVVDGDGDAYGIGGNHLIHTARRNMDITHIVQNNQVYALTKGQFSPTTDRVRRTSTSPFGVIEAPIMPLALALAAGATFVARGAAFDPKYTAGLMADAMSHPGYALLDIVQPCVSFNKINTYEWYRQRVYKVEERPQGHEAGGGPASGRPDGDQGDRQRANGHDSGDFYAAMKLAREWGDRIPLGVIYRRAEQPYHTSLPGLVRGPLPARALDDIGADGFLHLLDEYA